jgi:pimeloyl-ACP methyl ester carboxylesterase
MSKETTVTRLDAATPTDTMPQFETWRDTVAPATCPFRARGLSRRAVLGRGAAAGTLAALAAGPLARLAAAAQPGGLMTDATPAATPTVVLVHGAFADGSSWAGVIAALAGQGLTVVAPPNPLRGIAADAAYIASFVKQINGRVLLVGHSYGGAVTTNAASQANNVVGLVYVDAFLPDQGETLQQIAARATDSRILPALRPLRYPSGDPAKPGTEFVIDRAAFHAVFCADVPAAQAAVLAATQRPLSQIAFGEPTRDPAWKTLPSWAVFGTADQVIGVTGLRAMARRAKASTVEVAGGSHVVMVSQPAQVADVIRAALGAAA